MIRNILFILGFFVPAAVFGQVHKTDQIEVELLSESLVAVPGETLWLGIRLDPIEHWHTYWKFGGDSGEATSASDWQFPAGMDESIVGDIQWPIPEWTPFPGSDLVTFTYEREVLLPLPLQIPADFAGQSFDFTTRIDWQVCDEICIPGNANFSLSIPVGDTPVTNEQAAGLFAEARETLPVPAGEHPLVAQFNRHDGKVNVMIRAPEPLFADVDEAWFFPESRRIMRYAPYRNVMVDGDRIQISTEQHRRHDSAMTDMPGLLSFIREDGSLHAYEVRPTETTVAWDHSIEVELLSESDALVPGETGWLGLRLNPREHWHTYWKMGGDSGEPTSLNDWQAPEGSIIGEIQWPAPHWLPFYDTDLVNFGYEEEVVLPVAVTLPPDFQGDTVSLSTEAFWNVCDQICIPGEQRLDITLPVAQQASALPQNAAYFESARQQLPVQDHAIRSLIAVAGERVSLGFEGTSDLFAAVEEAWFFPEQRRIIKPGPLRDVSVQGGLLQITHQQPRRMLQDLDQVYGVLVLEDRDGGRRSFDFVNPAQSASNVTIAPLAAANSGESGSPGAAGEQGSLLLYMVFDMIGGLILNLMPCVFPVLSLKALSFTKNAGQAASKQRMDGLVYTAGVVIAFVLLASLLIALRAGGERIGWAFQFQQPWFLAFIVYLFFTMGLSLSGVFEIGTSLMGAGGSLTQKKGYKGSFFTGVLATVVATPCTAPFMGPAIGFALTQSWLVAMAVFIALGVGMALPILVLSFVPAMSRLLPQPGAWMETFKQFMAFPLYASALFFLWVLGNQVGVMGMTLVLGSCVLLAMAAWLYQRRFAMGPVMRTANLAFGVFCLAVAVYLMQSPFLETQPLQLAAAGTDGTGESNDLPFEAFSAQRLDELQAEGKPVFINMTAAWCITCLANEQTTLSTQRVQQVMAEKGITYLKGDWTNEDPEITAILDQFNRPSVPLYVFYSGQPGAEPVILPQILTTSIVTEAFNQI